MMFTEQHWRNFLNRAKTIHELKCPVCSNPNPDIELLQHESTVQWLCNHCEHTFSWVPPLPEFSDYIGQPWIKGQFDCWSLVRVVYRDCLAIELPEVAIDADNLRSVIREFRTSEQHKNWRAIEQPEHLCLAFFAIDHHRATHCGVWLDIEAGKFLHCARQSGVVLQDMPTLQSNGWGNPLFYRYCLE